MKTESVFAFRLLKSLLEGSLGVFLPSAEEMALSMHVETDWRAHLLGPSLSWLDIPGFHASRAISSAGVWYGVVWYGIRGLQIYQI